VLFHGKRLVAPPARDDRPAHRGSLFASRSGTETIHITQQKEPPAIRIAANHTDGRLVNTSTSISAYVDFLHYLWAVQYQQMAAASYSMSLARINSKALHASLWGIRAIDQMLGGSCCMKSPSGGRRKAGT
jgi:hypothetical protein